MLENGSVIIITVLLFILLCSCMSKKSGLSANPFKFKRSNPARAKFGGLEVECAQYPSRTYSMDPGTIRIPCGATAVRKLVDARKDETYGQEGLNETKEDWDSDMAQNIYFRTNKAVDLMNAPENMAARGPTAQRRNQVELLHNKHYN